jgi:general secretion pathway protein G
MNSKSKHFKYGFTLIELLVVIAIVGILSGFVFVSLSSAINASKDAKRKADISSIQKALMMYSAAGGSYPVLASCTVGATGCIGDPANNVLSNYLATMPTDPDSTKYYTYISSDGTNFSIQAILNSGAAYSYSTANGWNSGIAGYAHYKIITITNSSGATLTNYPIQLTLYKAAGQGAGGTTNCEGLCTDTFSDIGFADSNGNTALPFWLETASTTGSGATLHATFWLNVPSIATGSSTTIRMYYQSASPTLTSSGDNTFPTSQGMFFDDFNGSSLDASKWTPAYGTQIVLNGVVRNYNTGNVPTNFKSTYTTVDNYIVAHRSMHDSVATVSSGIGLINWSGIGTYTGGQPQYVDFLSGWGANSSLYSAETLNVYYIHEQRLSANTIYYRRNSGAWETWGHAETQGLIVFHMDGSGTGSTFTDWIFARKYASTEPTSSFGSQN